MIRNRLLGVLAFGGVAAIISCDSGSGGTTSGLASNDCPIGTFRPLGIQDCVLPSTDVNNQPLGVTDNRCAPGQPAIPPQCVSDTGARAYFSTSMTCAPGYRYLDGSCNRSTAGVAGSIGATTGFGTGFGTAGATGFGTAGFDGIAGSDGTAGVQGTAGVNGTAGFEGDAGSNGTAGDSGQAGAIGSSGAAGTGPTGAAGATGSGGDMSSDASTDESSSS